jgi:hypothetical protein
MQPALLASHDPPWWLHIIVRALQKHCIAVDVTGSIIVIVIIIIIITISFMQGIYIFLRQTMSLSNTMSQPFCRYCLWCPYH